MDIYCLPCSQESKKKIREELARIAEARNIELAKLPLDVQRSVGIEYAPSRAMTWWYTLINGIPVSIPVCLSHLPDEQAAPKPSIFDQPPGPRVIGG